MTVKTNNAVSMIRHAAEDALSTHQANVAKMIAQMQEQSPSKFIDEISWVEHKVTAAIEAETYSRLVACAEYLINVEQLEETAAFKRATEALAKELRDTLLKNWKVRGASTSTFHNACNECYRTAYSGILERLERFLERFAE